MHNAWYVNSSIAGKKLNQDVSTPKEHLKSQFKSNYYYFVMYNWNIKRDMRLIREMGGIVPNFNLTAICEYRSFDC